MSERDEDPRTVTAEEIEKWETERRIAGYLFVVHLIVTLLILGGCIVGGIYLSSFLGPVVSVGLTLAACALVVVLHFVIADKIVFKTGK
jgi:hypothetical protein